MKPVVALLVCLVVAGGCSERKASDTPTETMANTFALAPSDSPSARQGVWGEASAGLQCRAVAEVTTLQLNDPFRISVEIRNASRSFLDLLAFPMFEAEDVRFHVSTSEKTYVFEVNSENFDYKIPDLETLQADIVALAPGATTTRSFEISSQGLAVGQSYRAHGFIGRGKGLDPIIARDLFFVGPGKYTVRVEYRARDRGAKSWEGNMVSKPVTITVSNRDSR